MYNNNKIEGNRFGIGLQTNENVCKRIYIGGHIAYGDKDEEYKYGANIQLNIYKKSKLKFYLSYLNDYKLIDFEHLFQDYFIYDYTKYEEFKFQTSFLWNYFDIDFSLAKQKITPYQKLFNEQDNYNITEFELDVNYDFYKKYIPSFSSDYEIIKYSSEAIQRIIPKIELNYKEGISSLFNGEYSYSKIKLSTENNFIFSEIGELSLKTELGIIDREISYAKLFSGDKIFAEETFLYFDNVFQTVKPNEFISSRFANVFIKHKFRPIAFKTEYIKPTISLAQNIGFGELENNIQKLNTNLKSMNKGLYESGVVIEDILRISFLNFIYIGGGASCFYRWGKYENDDKKKNLNIKFKLSISY